MALWNPTFILGLVVLLYLSTFLLFAILRIITGISIQRVGYLSLRRIAYTPRDGIKLELRGLGFVVHRPTFAQPTWVSLVLEELHVTVDIAALGREHGEPVEEGARQAAASARRRHVPAVHPGSDSGRSRTWERMTDVKNRIKRMHRKIRWIRLIDLVATNSLCTVAGVGSVQVGSFTTAVDTRRRTVDRSRLFHHHHRFSSPYAEHPAEWIMTVRSVLFTPENREPLEILDQGSLNVHGLLYRDLDGLRDAAIALKLGRIHVPYDDFVTCHDRLRRHHDLYRQPSASRGPDWTPLEELMEERKTPSERQQMIMQTVNDSKEFVASILRGIKEVQFAVGFIGLTKQIVSSLSADTMLYLNLAMKEVGIDLHRLDSRAPAHRMYFSSADTAHQALAAAIGLSVDVDDGHGAPEKLLYLPMLTTTIKTTLPSKTIQPSEHRDAAERNANILFANIVITSPSLDLDPKHLPLVLPMLEAAMAPSSPSSVRPSTSSSTLSNERNQHFLSRLLPKANIKLSVHEPVMRIALPTPKADRQREDDYDLLISSISAISLDLESSHASVGKLHYSVTSTFRVMSHQLYYQTALGIRHDLLTTESLELRCQISAIPELHVVATANLQTFSVHMVRPEISEGVRQIVEQIRRGLRRRQTTAAAMQTKPSFLRRLPTWLVSFQLQGSDVGIEVAGVDSEVSENNRGIAIQLESWTAEYRAQRSAPLPTHVNKRRATTSRSSDSDRSLVDLNHPISLPRAADGRDSSDGRRLAISVRKLECFVVEAVDTWEPEAFVSLPRLDLAFASSSDIQGAVLHVSSSLKTLFIQYSLYRHYAIGVAVMVLRGAFVQTKHDLALERDRDAKTAPMRSAGPAAGDDLSQAHTLMIAREFVTVDVKVGLVQIKASMPADPAMMIQIFSLDTGRHRWAAPFVKAKVSRLYARAPRHRDIWARLVSIKNIRVDLRESRRKAGGILSQERSIDVATEAIRIGVPYQMVPHQIFDNITNVVKATEQLHHRFKTSSEEYILNKPPQSPKRVPRVSLRSKSLLFELEDSPFEWKLSTIHRVGLVEQKHRLAREEAFRAKIRKMEELRQRRGSSTLRSRSLYPPAPGPHEAKTDSSRPRRRHASHDGRRRASDRSGDRGRPMRYDPEGTCGMSEEAKVSMQDARRRLDEHHSQSWKKRIDWGMDFQKRAMRDIRGVFWGADDQPDGVDFTETLMEIPQRPGLMTTLINDLHIVLDKPSFPLEECPTFLHRIGKGMPLRMQYSLLIPLNIQLDMGETRVSLRDYPLALLHVPAIRSNQSARLPSWSLKTDFVIAEEYREGDSSRHVRVPIVPPDRRDSSAAKAGFSINVRRTVSPVKTYSDVKVDINTGHATRIAWGTAFQPAIQDMMMIFETFTKPQIDPSDRVGFWDKIRLGFHSRLNVSWKGDGDVHLLLKGSRNPYVVTGYGAGFVMCWRNDVRWQIARDEDPRKFMTVDSGEYILAIPDLGHQARQSMDTSGRDSDGISRPSSDPDGATFQKVVMKLNGNVRWLSGLVFERDTKDGGRSFDFKPHYDVTMKNPQYAVAAQGGGVYDAYEGFRSHHIHLSIAVVAPLHRDWSVTNLEPASNYNTVHLSPRYFTHYFNWWSMFSSAMSLPIRQGRLWPGVEKSSKKFGQHLATIKYNLLLSPLFISHVYKHKDVVESAEDTMVATGLKVRLDSFMLDLHQRREEFASQSNPDRKNQARTTGMRINQAQLDFINADFRAVSATFLGATAEDLRRAKDGDAAQTVRTSTTVDLSRFTIPDRDFSWVDMDDFVELDWILPTASQPATKILPLAFAPRFTYFRQTDHHDSVLKDRTGSSAFGNEPTHFCVMSQDNDPRKVQCDLIIARLAAVQAQMDNHWRSLGEAELKLVRDGDRDPVLREEYEMLKHHGEMLKRKQEFLQSMLRRMSHRIRANRSRRAGPDPEVHAEGDQRDSPSDGESDDGVDDMDATPLADFMSDFNNRFIIHNVQLKWNNSLRDIILRYIHQVSQRRGFVYYMSRRAVKFILDIVDEQSRGTAEDGATRFSTDRRGSGKSPVETSFEPSEMGEQVQEILTEAKRFVAGDERDDVAKASSPSERRPDAVKGEERPTGALPREFTAQNSYHVRLIAPQIQLQSEKNAKSAVLVTAKGMQLKVIQVMDQERVADDVSGLVQRIFSLDMDSVQFFVSNQKSFATSFLHMYAGTKYGTPAGSAWPPWVPMEVMFDFTIDPFGFSRVVQKTSASLRYEKYNTLRLKYNDELVRDDAAAAEAETRPSPYVEGRIDQLKVDFPQIRAICDSLQYYSMYIIVLDLLLHSEPLEKVRSERLEKIMLAADFSDLRGAPEMVTRLQERIRQLEEIKMHFQIHAEHLDWQGWEDRLSIERDIASCEDELFFLMKAITTSQRKYEDRSEANGLLRWSLSATEVVWHLIRDTKEPLVEFQLQNAEYERTDNRDGSNDNLMQIGRLYGLNLLPNALYPTMIAPFFDHGRSDKAMEKPSFAEGETKMLRVSWYLLEAIAGIPVVNHFEVNLFPLKVQLEREIGKKLFEYIFPGAGSSAFEDAGLSTPALKSVVSNGAVVANEEVVPELVDGPFAAHASTLLDESEVPVGLETLERRLSPTMSLSRRPHRSRTVTTHRAGKHGHSLSATATAHSSAPEDTTTTTTSRSHHFRLFPNKSPKIGSSSSLQVKVGTEARAPSIRTPTSKRSSESLTTTTGRKSSERSYTNLSALSMTAVKPCSSNVVTSTESASTTTVSTATTSTSTSRKRFILQRTGTVAPNGSTSDDREAKASDDLTQMIERASNYMSLAYVRIPSVVLCLSYKGRGERNIEDVHDFVFRMPVIEYRNKTWSNLDLALHLKKDVIRALISHTGAIIGNKLAHHRPSKRERSHLRDVVGHPSLLGGGTRNNGGLRPPSLADLALGSDARTVSSRSDTSSLRTSSLRTSSPGFAYSDGPPTPTRQSLTMSHADTPRRTASVSSRRSSSLAAVTLPASSASSNPATTDHEASDGSIADPATGRALIHSKLTRTLSSLGQMANGKLSTTNSGINNSNGVAQLRDSSPDQTEAKEKVKTGVAKSLVQKLRGTS